MVLPNFRHQLMKTRWSPTETPQANLQSLMRLSSWVALECVKLTIKIVNHQLPHVHKVQKSDKLEPRWVLGSSHWPPQAGLTPESVPQLVRGAAWLTEHRCSILFHQTEARVRAFVATGEPCVLKRWDRSAYQAWIQTELGTYVKSGECGLKI